jgi:hypothetical protein
MTVETMPNPDAPPYPLYGRPVLYNETSAVNPAMFIFHLLFRFKRHYTWTSLVTSRWERGLFALLSIA